MPGNFPSPELSVLSVGYPLLPVSAHSSGGAEQILYHLDRGLAKAGCQSIVIAAEGSSVSGDLIPTAAAGNHISPEDLRRAEADHLRCIERALERYRIDLIHFHGLDFHAYIPKTPVPKVVTLHLPPDWYPREIFDRPDLTLVCVSKNEADRVPGCRRPLVIENGIDMAQFSPDSDRGNSLLWLGRVCPEKGVHIALKVAHKGDLPLIVAGPVHPFHDHQTYFRESVQPLLDEKRRYIGPVEMEKKAALLRQARALLIPSLVAETSSLVAMEAISSGTPVIAFRSGALPEVVEHGVTGLIVSDQDEMADAVTRIGEISETTCRRRAEARFTASRMVAEYVDLYRRLTSSRHRSFETAPQEVL
jgi:glycosyltransferase involved in cell wall biosynthesis